MKKYLSYFTSLIILMLPLFVSCRGANTIKLECFSVNKQGAPLRKSPEQNSSILEKLNYGDALCETFSGLPEGMQKKSHGNDWVRVRSPSRLQGYLRKVNTLQRQTPGDLMEKANSLLYNEPEKAMILLQSVIEKYPRARYLSHYHEEKTTRYADEARRSVSKAKCYLSKDLYHKKKISDWVPVLKRTLKSNTRKSFKKITSCDFFITICNSDAGPMSRDPNVMYKKLKMINFSQLDLENEKVETYGEKGATIFFNDKKRGTRHGFWLSKIKRGWIYTRYCSDFRLVDCLSEDKELDLCIQDKRRNDQRTQEKYLERLNKIK